VFEIDAHEYRRSDCPGVELAQLLARYAGSRLCDAQISEREPSKSARRTRATGLA
jgi:hypothetical protein